MRLAGVMIVVNAMLWGPSVAMAEKPMFENFESGTNDRWRFVADTVMGGVSSGKMEIVSESGEAFARMTGQVSTANNGGFIQFRRPIRKAISASTQEVRLIVRGNDQRYFVHLRTSGTRLPWHYYQASFDVTNEWSEVVLPLDMFKASSGIMRETPKPDTINSIGIVAFGRDHDALIDVKELAFH